MDDLVIGMVGSGGDGIVSAGESLIAAAAYEGYYAMMTKSFGSQIRGGESSCRVRIASKRLDNPGGTLDVAVALITICGLMALRRLQFAWTFQCLEL